MSVQPLFSNFDSNLGLGFDSDGGQVLFHAADAPKVKPDDSNVVTGGVDDLNPIELTSTTEAVSRPPNSPVLPLPSHIENLNREAILNEGRGF